MASRRVKGAGASPLIRRGERVAEAFKAEFRKEIQRCGLTLSELSLRLGFGETYLANQFGRRKDGSSVALRVETVVALLTLLGLSFREFLERVERAEAGRQKRRPSPRRRS